jgi:hypothetical protein
MSFKPTASREKTPNDLPKFELFSMLVFHLAMLLLAGLSLVGFIVVFGMISGEASPASAAAARFRSPMGLLIVVLDFLLPAAFLVGSGMALHHFVVKPMAADRGHGGISPRELNNFAPAVSRQVIQADAQGARVMRDGNFPSWWPEDLDGLVFEDEVLRLVEKLGEGKPEVEVEVEIEVSQIYLPQWIELARDQQVRPIDIRDPAGGFGPVDLVAAAVVPVLAAVFGQRRSGAPPAIEAIVEAILPRVKSPRALKKRDLLIAELSALRWPEAPGTK